MQRLPRLASTQASQVVEVYTPSKNSRRRSGGAQRQHPWSAVLDRLARAVASTGTAVVDKESEGKVRLGEPGVAVTKLDIVMVST
jgi:hypothetical protein